MNEFDLTLRSEFFTNEYINMIAEMAITDHTNLS